MLTEDEADRKSCATCDFCNHREAFTKNDQSVAPLCSKFMLLLRHEQSECPGWEASS